MVLLTNKQSLEVNPHLCYSLKYKNRMFPLLLQAQSEVEVKGERTEMLEVSTNGPIQLSTLYSFMDAFGLFSFSQTFPSEIAKAAGVDAFEMGAFERSSKQKKYIDTLRSTEETKALLMALSSYQYWCGLYAYPIIKANAAPNNPVNPLPSVLTENFNPKLLSNGSHVCFSVFRDLVHYFITYKTSEANGFQKFRDIGLSVERKTAQAFALLNADVAKHAAARFINDQFSAMSEPVRNRQVSLLNEKDKQQVYKVYFETQSKNILPATETIEAKLPKKTGSGKDDPPFTLYDADGKAVSLNQFKGKVVYVDFWASWCGPCRAMFPYSKKLHESLTEKQRKEIVFVYISIDQTTEQWKTALGQFDLSNGINLHSPGNWQSEAVKYFKINSIPRYMIYNKKGELAESNARRPADNEVLNDLLKYAEE